jgi:valyl-tRNA synthetase
MMLAKMSKSRGNVVSPEEVIYGVCKLTPGYEFRDLAGKVVDFKVQGVWRQADCGYLTSTKFGRQPVFLHYINEPVPPLLANKLQHPDEIDYWINLLEKYEEKEE